MMYGELVSRETYDALKANRRWDYEFPVRKRYRRFLPAQAFAVGDNVSILVEAPTKIRFWAVGRKPMVKEIRLTYLVNNGIEEPYIKIHFE